MQMFLHLREKGTPHMKLATNKLEKRCSNAAKLIYAGRYEEARDELGELWVGIGERPQLSFAPQIRAEVLLQCGTLSGWLGSAQQLDVQEKAKDLLTEALHIFQTLNFKTKVSETRYELAECYWRLGAYDECRIVLDEAMRGLEDTELQARIMIRQTTIEIWEGKYYEALDRLMRAQQLFEGCSDAVKGRWHGQMALSLKKLATSEGRIDYADRAIIEFTAAIYHFVEARHDRYCAIARNNIAMLLYQVERYPEAHEHLDRARTVLEKLRDYGLLAQVEETRARVLVAEERYEEAGQVIIEVVGTLEKGGEQALLADALTIKATIQARHMDYENSLHTFRRAVNVAENAGALSNAGRAAMSMIEEHGEARLSDVEIYQAYRRADRWLAVTQDTEDIARLRACARIVILKLYGPDLDEYFTLPETVLKYEARFIEQALVEEGGSISRAARRLGLSHQTLGAIIHSRHKNLQDKRSPEIKRKRSIMTKDK